MSGDVAVSVAIGTLLGAAAAAFGLLVAGCMNWHGPHHPAAGSELAARDAAIDAWIDAGRDDPRGLEPCAPMERMDIVIVSPPPEGRSPCVYVEDGQRRYGASCVGFGEPTIGSPTHLLISLDTSLDAHGRLNGIAHEVLHHLRGCTSLPHLREGAAPAWWGRLGAGSDPGHQDAELWGPILDDAQRRAQEP